MSATVLYGDCRELMREMPDASVDSVVTDPPYDLTSIVKRFGRTGAAPCQQGSDGAFARTARGFMGQTWDGTGVAFDPATWAEVLRVLKPGGHLLAFGGSRTYHRMACAIEDAGFELRDQIMWIYGSGFPKSHNLDGEHDGWGTALKPAHEPIALARKPLVGSVAANVAQFSVGALNIEACRISGTKGVPASVAKDRPASASFGAERGRAADESGRDPNIGRWPANIIHDGSDAVIAAFPNAPGQQRYVGPEHGEKRSRGVFGDYGARHASQPRSDAGSAARFFYCAKASAADREEGCDNLEARAAGIVSETSGQHITRREESYEPPNRRNPHPTVKPEALMRYLVRLVTPAGGLVLDPFAGSGSTGKAAVLEGMQFVGCEMTAEYLPVARARIAAAVERAAAKREQAARAAAEIARQPGLFDMHASAA